MAWRPTITGKSAPAHALVPPATDQALYPARTRKLVMVELRFPLAQVANGCRMVVDHRVYATVNWEITLTNSIPAT